MAQILVIRIGWVVNLKVLRARRDSIITLRAPYMVTFPYRPNRRRYSSHRRPRRSRWRSYPQRRAMLDFVGTLVASGATHWRLTSNARSTSAIAILSAARRTAASLNSLVNRL
jgi:hypothetical protein